MSRKTSSLSDLRQGGWPLGLWLCLLVAFSPVLLDLSRHLQVHPWTRGILVFPWLVWVARQPNPDRLTPVLNHQLGRSTWIWLTAGLAIELLSIAGGSLRFGRIGLAVAVIGLCHGFRWVRGPSLWLILWAIPLPKSVMEIASPELQTMLGGAIAAVVPDLVFHTLDRVPTWQIASHQFPLASTVGGLSFVYGLTGLGWFRGRSYLGALYGAFQGAAIAIPIQLLLTLIAGLTLRITQESTGTQLLLSHGGWVLLLGLGLTLSIRKRSLDLRDPGLAQ